MDDISFNIKRDGQSKFSVNNIERHLEYLLPSHSHAGFWQVIVVTDGELTVRSRDSVWKMSAGDVHILPPGYTHSLESTGYRQIGMDIDGDISRLDAFYSHFAEPTVIHVPFAYTASRQIEAVYSDDGQQNELIFSLCDVILLSAAGTVRTSDAPMKRRILEYIGKNPADCRLDSASAALFISPSHLERRCREYFGTGFASFAAKRRFELACTELVGTCRRVGDIAESLGFSEVSNFSAFFKRYAGVSPAEYRRSYSTVSKY